MVVGRRRPASTNLVTYCCKVRVWYFTPSISKISWAVRGISSQNSNTFRCFAVKRTWLLSLALLGYFSAPLGYFLVQLGYFFAPALLLFRSGLTLFGAALLLFPDDK